MISLSQVLFLNAANAYILAISPLRVDTTLRREKSTSSDAGGLGNVNVIWAIVIFANHPRTGCTPMAPIAIIAIV